MIRSLPFVPPLYVLASSAALAGCLWISASDHAQRTDFDRDGSPADQDCNDRDASVAPGNTEIPCNGKDDDCDPASKDGPAFSGSVTYDSVQAALDLANPGAEITICGGTITEPLVIQQNNVVVSGNGEGDPTIINVTGQDAVSAVTVLGADVQLQKLVITGGTGNLHEGTPLGGGVDAYDAAGDVTLQGVEVYGCSADVGGGVVGPSAHNLTLIDSNVHDDTAVATGGGISVTFGSLTLVNTAVDQNAAAQGGGLWVVTPATVSAQSQSEVVGNTAQAGAGVASSGSVSGLDIRQNTATGEGGGVLLSGGDLTDVLIYGNTAAQGGGIAGYGSALRASVVGNTATSTVGGGGILAEQFTFQLTGVTIQDNLAPAGDGGGVLALGPATLDIGDDASAVPTATVFDGNTALGHGGAIAAYGAGITMVGGTLKGSHADQGGGLAVWGVCTQVCDHVLTNVTLTDNSAREGGGWYTESDVTAVALSIKKNNAVGNGGGVYVVGGSVNDTRSTYEGNTAESGGAIAWSGSGSINTAVVSDNTASEDGSGLWMINGALSCQADFQYNHTQGATVSGLAGALDLTTASFKQNEAYDLYMCDKGCSIQTAYQPYTGSCSFGSIDCDYVAKACAPTVVCP